MRFPLLLSVVLILGLISACAPATPDANFISTLVASTVMAGGGVAHSVEVSTGTPSSAPIETTIPTEAVVPIRVSFVNTGHNLFVWSDGTSAPVQLTTSADVMESYISSDGSLIAFTRSTDYMNYQVDVINYDGTNQSTLLTATQINSLPRPTGSISMEPHKIAWIPGSHRMAMNFQVHYEGPGLQIADTLYVLDADTASFSPLLTVGSSWNFVISPDASKFLITRPEGIDLYNANGSLILANVITHPFVNTASEYAWVADPTWASDSSAFATGIPPQEPWVTSPAATMIYKVSNAGTIQSSFSSPAVFFPSGTTSFNPSLTKVSFSTRVGAPEDNTWALHISGLDGSADSTLATGYISDLATWAPDGLHYIYSVMTGSNKQAYLGAEGTSSILLTGITTMMDVRWIDNTRYVISNKDGTTTSLLLGVVGSGFSVIYNDTGSEPDRFFNFDVNR
jgi:hypothetical protein